MVKEMLLGQKTVYAKTYSPDLLYPVPRTLARDKIGIKGPLPFHGFDIWNAFELSWLDAKGKPEIALAELVFPSDSPFIVESKSLKLYLCSLHQTRFQSKEDFKKLIQSDLEKIIQKPVGINLFSPSQMKDRSLVEFSGTCIDAIDVEIDTYDLKPEFLKTESREAEETLYSDLLKSNCLATGQPDWGSIQVYYSGPKIDQIGLLKYIISYRNHSGFAEHCAEQMFYDILTRCKPNKLSVYIRYTKRGGLDINPFRSNFETSLPSNLRHLRQ